jgi:CubicO group peptidase (beta-lactamase class C family)
MKNCLLCILLIAVNWLVCFSQGTLQVTYQDLKEYEGNYEYFNNTRLQFAASPKDNALFAIINETKYPLKLMKKDLFLDGQNSQVIFERNRLNKIRGYRVISKEANHFFRLLSREVFPERMWYPRYPNGNQKFEYRYAVPKNLNDGLAAGSLASAGLDAAAVTEMVNRIADSTYKNVHSVLIIKDGKLVLEEYFYEYDQSRLHQLRSATKSFVSALVGIAIDSGVIESKNATVLSFFPEYDLKNLTEDKKRITIENLLTNQSGLDCDDNNESSSGNEVKMGRSPDWVKFILDLPMVDKPGSRGRYCSGGVIVLGRIIEKATGKSISDFASRNLFKPLGISDFKWNFKPDNSSAESFCQISLAPRDMAKFGLLYLNGGKYNGKQIVSSEWVKASLSKQSVVNNTDYGYLWWRQWLSVNGRRVDGVTARGNGGQRIYLWPDLNMVAVITGGNYNERSPSDQLLINYILPSFVK